MNLAREKRSQREQIGYKKQWAKKLVKYTDEPTRNCTVSVHVCMFLELKKAENVFVNYWDAGQAYR